MSMATSHITQASQNFKISLNYGSVTALSNGNMIFKAVKCNIYCFKYSNNHSFKMGEINFNMLSYNVSRVLAFQYVTNAKKSA